jgi:phosphatidylglycerophosphate synthase
LRDEEKMMKRLDSWSEVFVVDPIAIPIAKFLSNFNAVNPLYVTLSSFLTGLLTILLSLRGQFILAGITLFVSIILDGIDGKIARSKGQYINVHSISDQMSDQIVFLSILISIALVNAEQLIYILIFLAILYLYEVSYALRIEMYRKNDDLNNSDFISRYNIFISSLKNRTRKSIFQKLIKVLDGAHRFTFKYRTFPYPKTSDARFLLLFYFLIPNSLILVLMMFFILPDLAISLILLAILAVKRQEK